MRAQIRGLLAALVVVAGMVACAGDGPLTSGRPSSITMRFLTPATVRSLIVEVSGPGIDPAVILNVPVNADTVATATLTLPSGSGRRFTVTAVDTAGVQTHRADTTITLQPGANPALAMLLEPLGSTLGITVTFGGAQLTVTDTTTRVLEIGELTEIQAYARRANGDTLPADSLTWASINPAVATVDGGRVSALRAGSGRVVVSYQGASAHVSVSILPLQGVRASASGAALGGSSTCALATDGAAYCWGENRSGQMGDGTTEGPRLNPQTPVGAPPLTALASGSQHICGLTSAGAAWCWGQNVFGELGDGTTTARTSPVLVVGAHTFVSLTAGTVQTCGLAADGRAWCWGNGYLGDGPSSRRSEPVQVLGDQVFAVLEAGSSHTCGLTAAGAAWCWGANGAGQLGDGTTTDRFTPVAVSGGYTFVSLALGDVTTCGLTATGAVWCWGGNSSGQLGNGTTGGVRLTPGLVPGVPPLVSIAAGPSHLCGVTSVRTAWCWGNNIRGQLGDGTTTSRSFPVMVAGGIAWRALVLGKNSALTCGWPESGGFSCWGNNIYGEMGDGTRSIRLSPFPVVGGESFILLAAGRNHTCGLIASREARCWGRNLDGELGDGTYTTRAAPVAVAGGITFSMLAGGNGHTCGLAQDATAWCWGRNANGQIGDGTSSQRSQPVRVVGNRAFSSLALGFSHSCGVAPDGSAWCWGSNSAGQLGDGTLAQRLEPVQVVGGQSFDSIAVGNSHACGLARDGSAWCWGSNSSGQLGDGTTTARSTPGIVAGGLSFVALTAGASFTCGLTAAGGAWCWGSISSKVPVAIGGGNVFVALKAGVTGTFWCGLTVVGATLCWGSNDLGQLGDGTRVNRFEPTAVTGTSTFSALALGFSHGCGLAASGAVSCWGNNTSGQLGDPTTFRITPTPVLSNGIVFRGP
jgi:alpha-tubulin suppressor-like RCC1 family protein